MKRKITFLIAALCAVMLITQPTCLWGQAKGNITITSSSWSSQTYTTGHTFSVGGISFTDNGICYNQKNTPSGYAAGQVIVMRKSSNGAGEVYNTSSINTITSIEVGVIDNGGISVFYGDSSNPSTNSIASSSLTPTSGSFSYTNSNGGTSSATVSVYTFDLTSYKAKYFKLINGTSVSRLGYIKVNYTPTHTITYSASNGSIGGVLYGTSTAVESNEAVYEGGKVTLTATPASGYTFSSWEVSGTGSTLSSTTTNPTTFTMGTANATVTAIFVAASGYINVSPNPANVTCVAQNAEFTITTDQTLDANPVVFYTTSTGDVTTTQPSWIGDLTSAYSSSTLTIPVTANTGAARTAYFRVEKGSVKSDVITINQAVYGPTAPTLPAAGNFDYTKEITITAPSGTVYYTLDGTDPTSGSTAYSAPFTINATKTVKAIAYDNGYPSAVVSATYTRTYHDISSISSTSVYYYVKGTVVATNTKGFVFGDATGYVYDYYATSIPSVGSIVSITNQKVSTYGKVYEFKTASAPASNSTYNSSDTPTIIDGDDIYTVMNGSTNYISNYQQFVGTLTKSGDNYFFEVAGDSHTSSAMISYPTTDQSDDLDDLDGEIVKVNGYFTGIATVSSTSYYSVMLESIEAVPVITTTETSLTGFTYAVGSGPSASQSFKVNATNLKSDITVALSNTSSFEMSEDNSTFSTDDITIDKGEGTVTNKTIYVRLKAGLSSGTFTPNITLSSTDAENKTVTLNGTVTAPYTINLEQHTGGTISTNKETASAGETIYLYVDLEDCYNLTGWTVLKDDLETEVTVTEDHFTMPDCDVLVEASFTQKTFTVTYSFNGNDIYVTDPIDCGDNTDLLDEDDLEILEVSIPSGFYFVGWSATENSSTTVSSPYEPSATTTLYAVLTYGQAEAYYTKVTSSLGTNWAGDYLIAYNDETFADGRVGGTGTGGIGASGVDVDLSDYISGNNIPATYGDTYKVTLEEISENSNTYVLKTQDGKYNYYTSNANGLSTSDYKTTADDYPITITFTSANDIRLCLGGNASGAVFRYNTNGYFRFYGNCSQQAVYLYKRTTTEVPNFNEVTNVTSTQTINTDISANECVIVSNNAILTFGGVNNGTAANIVVNDGSQLITTNPVAATINKSIDAPAAKTEYNSWYTISSPVTDGTHDYIAIASLSSLTADDYDMLAYDEVNHTWRNQKASLEPYSAGFLNMDKGQGYMYRNNDSDISFVGTTNTGTFSNDLSYTDAAGNLAGFHLVGNPYSHNITLLNTTLLKENGDPYETQLGGCYILTNNNSWGSSLSTIKPTQGFLIQITTADVKKIQFSETPRAAKSRSNGDNIEFIVSNSEYKDNTFALFDNVMGLNKIEHRNTEVPMIYIPQNGTNYAIAPMSDDTQMFGLNFKAATMGQYSLSMKAAGEYNYIHVIDRLTGEDIDMLLEGKYSFIGSPRDNESRFIVKLGYVPGSINDNNEIFAYQSGSDIIVTGSGELQIFDVTGRSVMSTMINGVETIQVPTTGMYIFRLVGSEVKTQKIVVE